MPNSSSLSSEISIQPPSSLQTSDIRKRHVSYRFSASPTSGVTHKVAFIPLRTGIPQPQNKTFHKSRSGSRKMSGLTPDVTYRLQVAAKLGDVESTAISVNFTTKPDGKTAMTALYYKCDSMLSSWGNPFQFFNSVVILTSVPYFVRRERESCLHTLIPHSSLCFPSSHWPTAGHCCSQPQYYLHHCHLEGPCTR